MKNLLKIISLVFVIFSVQDICAQTKKIAFTHATLIDMTERSAQPKPNMTVIRQGRRIATIGKTGKVKIPKDAQIIDASGKFLIPGLWDMHAHVAYEQITREIFFPLDVANGITGVRDMFSDCSRIARRITAV